MLSQVEFTLVTDNKDNVKIAIDPHRVETVVNGAVMNNPLITQIAMQSGRTFFVAHPYTEVKEALSK